ncbi:tail fiber protein [Alisedimentitalea sp. MJ-SS2]|uniref:phage tail protein n=1 Tax=Aliisedimentitalea sp. MJ-SS2 TaxID=3049795 RepID=UPI002907C1C9|nr:tail fiber protein [Alisedimentitalea sp. MJ-SS2]MDU8926640.1 tail fiber protein [Alisedimentitalea sp. MJ-SS2]
MYNSGRFDHFTYRTHQVGGSNQQRNVMRGGKMVYRLKRYVMGAGLALMATLSSAPVVKAETEAEPFIGQMMLFGANFCPRNFAHAEGQLLAITENEALFSLLGTAYGGDGRTTFALPDLRGQGPKPVVIDEDYPSSFVWCIALQGLYPSRSEA